MTEELVKKEAERAFATGHYKSLSQAVVMAMYRCLVWRLAETGRPLTPADIFAFAQYQDKEHPIKDPQFYMVSAEGAIGISTGFEYLTKWIFVPMEPGEERDQMMEKVNREYKQYLEQLENKT